VKVEPKKPIVELDQPDITGIQAAVWGNFLQNLLKNLQVNSRADTLGAGAMQAKSAPVITVNPVVENKLLEVDGTVVAVVIIAGLGLAFFILRSELARKTARQWKDAAGVVMDSVEEEQAERVKDAVARRTLHRPEVKARLDAYLAEQGYLSNRPARPACP
jgi:hypothetical protein